VPRDDDELTGVGAAGETAGPGATGEAIGPDPSGAASTGADIARDALARARANRPLPEQRRRRRVRRAEQRSGARPDDRDPKPFGAAVRELLRDRGWDDTMSVATVMGQWEALVGPDVAAHCRPERLDEGTLVLVAESTAWATQLRLLSRSIVERLAREVGPNLVRQVRVKGPATPDWRHGPRRVTGGRGPRDTYG